MSEARIYNELAHLWPLISPPLEDATRVEQIVSHLGDCRSILELGCGAGHTLCQMDRERFDLTGVDASSAMIELSRERNPHATHHVADMRTVRLERTFDAVVAHDALEYMVTERDLRDALATAAAHLEVGGTFIAAVTDIDETFIQHDCAADTHDQDNTQVTHISYVRRHPSAVGVQLEMVLLIREAGELRIEHDTHHCGLFPEARWRSLFQETGFELQSHTADESGVWFVARKAQ